MHLWTKTIIQLKCCKTISALVSWAASCLAEPSIIFVFISEFRSHWLTVLLFYFVVNWFNHCKSIFINPFKLSNEFNRLSDISLLCMKWMRFCFACRTNLLQLKEQKREKKRKTSMSFHLGWMMLCNDFRFSFSILYFMNVGLYSWTEW